MTRRRLRQCLLAAFAALLACGAAVCAPQLQTPEAHRRTEDQTYLTFPEWFLVFSPAEYADVTDEAAVLVEPLACCVHAVRGSLPAAGERVLVIGAGSIGLLTIAALHALAPGAEITALARHGFDPVPGRLHD